uniref:Uncharacterized protein n=1 Tax=Pelusios castaneus TaxID=367368 RepID=A0A8C8RKT9_9SAUR
MSLTSTLSALSYPHLPLPGATPQPALPTGTVPWAPAPPALPHRDCAMGPTLLPLPHQDRAMGPTLPPLPQRARAMGPSPSCSPPQGPCHGPQATPTPPQGPCHGPHPTPPPPPLSPPRARPRRAAPTFDDVAVDGGAELLAGRPVPVLPVDDPHLLEEGGLAALARPRLLPLRHVIARSPPRRFTSPCAAALSRDGVSDRRLNAAR